MHLNESDHAVKRLLSATTALIAAGLIAGRADAADPIGVTPGSLFQTAAGVEVGRADKPGEPSLGAL